MAFFEPSAGPAIQVTSPPVYHSVWVKEQWSDEWSWAPYLRPLWAVNRTAPTVSQAQFDHHFGRSIKPDSTIWDIYSPYVINGFYVAVQVHDYWGTWTAWVGVIEHETGATDGTTAYPQGDQVFSAFGVEHLLDRQEISASRTDQGWIDRPLVFNKRAAYGIGLLGNRSTDKEDDGEGTGEYVFSADGEEWNNRRIIDHLLRYQTDGPTFELTGQTTALERIIEEVNVNGLTTFQALNKLIDQRRGLGWKIAMDPTVAGSTIYIYVFSTLAEDFLLNNVMVLGNRNAAVVYLEGRRDAEAQFSFDRLKEYDRVNVLGGPIRVMCTLSIDDATLEQGWTATQETNYKAGSTVVDAETEEHDDARQSEQFEDVYQKFIMPTDWDGYAGDGTGTGDFYDALPVPMFDGNLHILGIRGSEAEADDSEDDSTIPLNRERIHFPQGRTFDRNLLIVKEDGASDAEPEYRKPFVIVENEEDADTWSYVDKLKAVEMTPAHVRLADNEMAIYVEPAINHIAALTDWEIGSPEDSNTEPEYDWNTYRATVAFATDMRLRVVADIPNARRSGSIRMKLIEVPEAEAWFVVNNTIVDVVDSNPIRYGSEEYPAEDNNLERWDGDNVQAIAAFAVSYYSQAHATAAIKFDNLYPVYDTGTMLLGAYGQWHNVDLGTVVTSQRFDFRRMTTTINTGHEEINMTRMTGFGDGKK